MKFFKLLFNFFFLFSLNLKAQNVVWQENDYFTIESGEIQKHALPENTKMTFVDKVMLTPKKSNTPIEPKSFAFTADGNKILIFTNTQRVWRQETRGDYWILNLKTKALTQLGKGRPASSLMFAKLSPNGQMAAYVSERNLYIEDLKTHKINPLTQTKGKIINGTFDWAYEEEFDCRDGFRWSPDSKSIAYWQIDATKIKDFLMINNTDEIYAKNIPVEYPKVGESPSACKVGVANIATKKTIWMNVPGDPQQHYIPRMEWANNSNELLIQQLNRKQNESKLMYCNAKTGVSRTFYQEKDAAWIDVRNSWSYGNIIGWDWIENGKSFIWVSEKDGWRHIYKVSRDGKTGTLLTEGNYDIQKIMNVDIANDYIYFMASPDNATQSYLYRTKISQVIKAEKVSPTELNGTHNYRISDNGKYAFHNFSNYFTPRVSEIIALPSGKPLDEAKSILTNQKPQKKDVEFFQVTTTDGIKMDGFIAKPQNFDPKKKYPIVFYVYSEPAGVVVTDVYGVDKNRLYTGDMAADGYIYAALDGRGTPAPKGREWRKSIYRKVGIVNIRDQAMGALAMFKKYDFIDTSRVAIWGWSGGGSATLNCLFQYPDIYKTGISIAAVANQLTYDNIYQERYMGLPQENKEDFVNGSPMHFVKNFRGNLLYIHGTGDDNVHYQNAELLINEMIKYNKQFQFMPYPNRSHGIYEGEGTTLHLSTLYTKYLKEHCVAGGR
jgi:dipeptidyl-peptidase-4